MFVTNVENPTGISHKRAAVAKCFWGFSTKLMKKWSYPVECAEPSAHSEEKASSKQSLQLCSFPAALHLQWTTKQYSRCNVTLLRRPIGTRWTMCKWNRQIELTNESGLGGAKHSDRTIFVIVSVPSCSSGQAGRHVEVGANVSAYATTENSLTGKWYHGNTAIIKTYSNRNLLLIYNSTLTFGVKALGDPVLPKHHIHPLAMATHKQSHLRQGGLTNRPCHLT